MIQTQAPGPESSLYFHEDGDDSWWRWPVQSHTLAIWQGIKVYTSWIPLESISNITAKENKLVKPYQFYLFPRKVTIWQTLWQMLDGEQWWGPDLVAEKRPFCGFAVGGDRGWTSGQAHVNHGLANWAHVHNWPRGDENQNLVKGYSWPCQVKLSWKSLPTPKSY